MAIIAPADLPVVLKLPTDPIKKYVLTMLGHPTVNVELTEDQWETIIRTSGDFIAGYFPREQRMAWFQTTPLASTYPMPKDAYWITEVQWDPLTTNAGDIFGADYYLFNGGYIGNLAGGGSELLLDIHLLQSYRKFVRKILGTEGHWEVIGEVDGGPGAQRIRLYPTPKGAFPVVVVYYPVVNHFRSPQARKLAMDMILAEARIVLGEIRSKLTGIPTPDGGSLQLNGEALVQKGNEDKEKIIELALKLGEPDRVFLGSLIPLFIMLLGSLKYLV